jgi:serine/threonine-protein kinase RsbT
MKSAGAARLRILITDDSDVVIARQRLRELCQREGLSRVDTEGFATALTEIGRNIVVHAGRGEIELFIEESSPVRRGVAAIARDTGPGITDLEAAQRDGHSTSGSLGLGLPSAKRLVDDFELHSSAAGTTVLLRMWSPRTPRTRAR